MDFLLYKRQNEDISIRKIILKKIVGININNGILAFFYTLNKQSHIKYSYLLVFFCLKTLPRSPPFFFRIYRKKKGEIHEK